MQMTVLDILKNIILRSIPFSTHYFFRFSRFLWVKFSHRLIIFRRRIIIRKVKNFCTFRYLQFHLEKLNIIINYN